MSYSTRLSGSRSFLSSLGATAAPTVLSRANATKITTRSILLWVERKYTSRLADIGEGFAFILAAVVQPCCIAPTFRGVSASHSRVLREAIRRELVKA
jgi:hypothetical protein